MPDSPPATPASGGACRALFVGNSLTYWNDGIDRCVAALGSVHTDRVVAPGASLKTLWQSGKAADKIRGGGWTAVVLQEDLPETNAAHFLKYGELFVQAAEKAGATPLLLMAWAYKRLPRVSQDDIVRAHLTLARQREIAVVPAGFAFERATTFAKDVHAPSLRLLSPDNEHPSLAGTYVASLLVHQRLLGLSSRAASSRKWAPAGLDADEAAWLRSFAVESSAAWEAFISDAGEGAQSDAQGSRDRS